MAADSYYEGIAHTVQVSTGYTMSCEHCQESIDGDFLDKSINHYIDQHGSKLLHIGTQSTTNVEGNIWNDTIAILGK